VRHLPAIAAVLVGATACGGAEPPDYRGTVERLEENGGAVLISHDDDACGLLRLRVREETELVVNDDNDDSRALTAGDRVDVWTSGLMQTSCPAVITADRIVADAPTG